MMLETKSHQKYLRNISKENKLGILKIHDHGRKLHDCYK